MRIVCALAILALSTTSNGEEAKQEKNLNEPIRVPVIKCTEVCDRQWNSPDTTDPSTWITDRCEIRCEPTPPK